MQDNKMQVSQTMKADLLQTFFAKNDLNGVKLNSSSTSLSFCDSHQSDNKENISQELFRPSFEESHVKAFFETEWRVNFESGQKSLNGQEVFVKKDQQQNQQEDACNSNKTKRQWQTRARKSSFFSGSFLDIQQMQIGSNSIYCKQKSRKEFLSDLTEKRQNKYSAQLQNTPLNKVSIQLTSHDLFQNETAKINPPAFSQFYSEMLQSTTKNQILPRQNQTFQQCNFNQNTFSRQYQNSSIQFANDEGNKVSKAGPICFYCGLKHYYDQCAISNDPKKLENIKCMNCKKQGHSAKYCKEPKRCNICHSYEHLAKNCPDQKVSLKNKVCLNCNKIGHFAKQCFQPRKCFLCHKVGHQIKNCPSNRHNVKKQQHEKVCFNCKKIGHYANECPDPQKCHNCRKQGHYSRDCPYILRANSIDQSDLNLSKIKQETESIQKANSDANANANAKIHKKKINFKRFNLIRNKKDITTFRGENQIDQSKPKSSKKTKLKISEFNCVND